MNCFQTVPHRIASRNAAEPFDLNILLTPPLSKGVFQGRYDERGGFLVITGEHGKKNHQRRPHLFYTVSMALPPDLSLTDSFKNDRRKAFYERHKGVALVMILIVFLLPLIGVFVNGLSGAALGMLISVLAYYLAPYALLKLGGWIADSKG
jgi:hypothetical protein